MKSSKIISIGNGSNSCVNTHNNPKHHFLWKVDLTYIHRLRPNFEIGSLVGRNLQ